MTQIQPIPVVTEYFEAPGVVPVISAWYRPGHGWKRYPFNKRVSRAWLRKMREEGATEVSLSYDGRTADFGVNELLRSAAR